VTASLITAGLVAFLLYLARVGALILSVPVFGGESETRLVRVGLAATVAFLLLRTRGIPPVALAGSGTLALALLGEIGLGLMIGWAVRLALSALALGGHLVGQEMGLNMSNLVDPITGQETPLVSSLFELLGVILFFAFGLHRALFRLLAGSYEAMPAGLVRPSALPWARWASAGLSHFFEIGVRLVAPAFVVLMLVTLSFGLLMRAVPTINVFDVGFVLRITVAFGLVAALLPQLLPVTEYLFLSLRDGLGVLLGF
jgi:flagellar biosynthetic protein FliR